MTDESPSQERQMPDLSELTNFQFGPAWARNQDSKERLNVRAERKSDVSRDDRRRRERNNDEKRRQRGDRFSARDSRSRTGKFDSKKHAREERPLVSPTEGVRVELRPVDSGLQALQQEIQKHRRVISLMDLAKVIMSANDRYDVVFMKQENGPMFFRDRTGTSACFISKQEAVKHLWNADWFDKYYTARQIEVESPKGEFKAIAKCSLNNELLGPINWHGYQTALHNLHKTKFAHLPFEFVRSKVTLDKSEEVIAAWKESVSKQTVWQPVRQGAESVTLESPQAVEQDFITHHFDECFEETDKVFINGSVRKTCLSPGLWAHLSQLAKTTKHHPSMLIPNICHGLARHRLPIFKWQGNHFTGPARPKGISEGAILSDSLMSIADWVAENSGKGVDLMIKDLVKNAPEQQPKNTSESETDLTMQVSDNAEQEENTDQSQNNELQQNLVRDLLWLAEQGYILIFADNTVQRPKTVAKQPENVAQAKTKKISKNKDSKKKVKTTVKSDDPKTESTTSETLEGSIQETDEGQTKSVPITEPTKTGNSEQ